jgi:hypothetical protein
MKLQCFLLIILFQNMRQNSRARATNILCHTDLRAIYLGFAALTS